MKPELIVSLLDDQQVADMIDSKLWWIFLGDQELIDDVERIARDRFGCAAFPTVIGPPPTSFKTVFPDVRFLPLTFAKKSDLPWDRLRICIQESGGPTVPIDNDGTHDILCLMTEADLGGKES